MAASLICLSPALGVIYPVSSSWRFVLKLESLQSKKLKIKPSFILRKESEDSSLSVWWCFSCLLFLTQFLGSHSFFLLTVSVNLILIKIRSVRLKLRMCIWVVCTVVVRIMLRMNAILSSCFARFLFRATNNGYYIPFVKLWEYDALEIYSLLCSCSPTPPALWSDFTRLCFHFLNLLDIAELTEILTSLFFF